MSEEKLELTVERRIEASVERVWQALTERLEDWFCPKPWRAEVRHLDWRSGGRSAILMHGPSGEQMPTEGIVLEFVPHKRFVLTRLPRVGSHPVRSW